ncbi:MAG: VOC family protein [Longimicrobiales bacterium]
MDDFITHGFHHITMVSGDARRTAGFYRDLLGIAVVKRTVNFDDPGSYHLYFGDAGGQPGTLLTFFEWRDAYRGRWGVGGIHHLALGASSPEAQLKWKRRLMDAGVSVTGPYNRGYFHSIYFADPDGQILEIATQGPGYAIDEPFDQLGQNVMIPKDAQLRGQRDETRIRALTHSEPVPEITSDMVLQGIHHITGFTDDIVRADEFYHAALGLRLVKKSVNQDDPETPHWFWASYDGSTVKPHSSLTLFEWKNSDYRSRPGVGQTHHIAFRAKSIELQNAWREHLLSMGLTSVSPVLNRSYFQSIYFRAPDGLLLEIATDGPGFLIDEPVGSLGSTLQLPDWLETKRPELERTLTPLG